MADILLADDEMAIREGFKVLLESNFHHVRTAVDGSTTMKEYRSERPHLLVLDVMMPNGNGLDICREIRTRDAYTPILMLSARDSEMDKVLGLGIGADDYLSKTSGPQEFLARISALLRRSSNRREYRTLETTAYDFPFGDFKVCSREMVLVNRKNERIPISCRELALLQIFADHPREVLSRSELMNFAWGNGYYTFSRTLDQHIYTLRNKIAGCGWSIETIVRSGYRLSI